MEADDRISVLIVYSHPLLGEGLLGMLAREPGLDVGAVPIDDPAAVEGALAASPQVVIAERGVPDLAVGILEQVPDALVIEVGVSPGPTFAYRRDEIPALPEAVIAAIRQASTRRGARQDRDDDPAPEAVVRA